MNARRDSQGNRDQKRDNKPCKCELHRGRITRKYSLEDLVRRVDEARTEITANEATPIVQILPAKRQVQSKLMFELGYLLCGRIVTEGIAHRIARHNVNQKKNQGDDCPDYGKCQQEALCEHHRNIAHRQDDKRCMMLLKDSLDTEL